MKYILSNPLAHSNGNLIKSVKDETFYDVTNYRAVITPKDKNRDNSNINYKE